MSEALMSEADLKKTPLHALHVGLGAKMVPFAGYEMPVQYPAGVMTEHRLTRSKAGLFDVSHMGQVLLHGDGAAKALERLVPGNIQGLAQGSMRYTLFTNAAGGIIDDLIVTNGGDHLYVVVNAACKDQDIALMRDGLDCPVEVMEDRALLALQGPAAEAVLDGIAPGVAALGFMTAASFVIAGERCIVTRSGYTGEDGFEISMPAGTAVEIAEMLLAHDDVAPIGLGARDSLRLEAGLCLYGHDLGPDTTPVEAALEWTIGKRRREEGGFPGAEVILKQLAEGAPRRRVGIRPDGRAPARGGTEIVGADGSPLGAITSGGFGPSVEGPVAMGYVRRDASAVGTPVNVVVRGKPLPAKVAALPFVTANFKRG
jgi:aminomethyltransferase